MKISQKDGTDTGVFCVIGPLNIVPLFFLNSHNYQIAMVSSSEQVTNTDDTN